ncbi:MAG TPA: hypothetical protein ENJ09_08950 [Planctomycetes bacterium]|nr:hypothetical protein [Planctomycetota bacterium]
MSFSVCPNCLGLHTSSEPRCPICGADEEGLRAEHPFGAETRSAIQELGGLFGGILDGPEADTMVLWCSHGVVLVDRGVGLRWRARVSTRIGDVRVRRDVIELVFPGAVIRLDPSDGSELEESQTP